MPIYNPPAVSPAGASGKHTDLTDKEVAGVIDHADDSVTLEKMAHGTQGDILYYGVGGAPARLPAGTSGHVLTSQGAGANPIWQPAGTPGPHAATHQDGGTDEINIAGLSGEPAELTTHKGLTTGVHGVTGNIVGTTDTQTLSNKTLGSDLNAGGFRITGLGAPVADTDAARKADIAGAKINSLTLTDTTVYSSTSPSFVIVKTFTLTDLPTNARILYLTYSAETYSTSGVGSLGLQLVPDNTLAAGTHVGTTAYKIYTTTYTLTPTIVVPAICMLYSSSNGKWGYYAAAAPTYSPAIMDTYDTLKRGCYISLTRGGTVEITLARGTSDATAYVMNQTLKIFYLLE